jgi:hypothetical protein
MGRKVLLALLILFVLPSIAPADNQFFFEIGPRYSLTVGHSPLAEYWKNGIGIGGTLGFPLRDDLDLVTEFGYQYHPHSGGGPWPSIVLEMSNSGFSPFEGHPGPFAESSSLFDAAVKLRMHPSRKGISLTGSYVTLGFGFLYKTIGDVVVFTQRRWGEEGYDPFLWSGSYHSGSDLFIAFGFGSEIFHYKNNLVAFEIGGNFILGGETSVHLPIKLKLVF